jgi:hypothetical protein
MIYSYDKFLRPVTLSDRNIKILDDNGDINYTIDPFAITNIAAINNILRISLKSLKVILLNFSTRNEARIAVGILQTQIDSLTNNVPILIDKDIQNYIHDLIDQVGIIIGPTGASGPTGLIGATGSADRYIATSSTSFEMPEVGQVINLLTQSNLAYSTTESVVVYSDFPNLYNDDYEEDGGYFIGQIDYYDIDSGSMSLVTTYSNGTGTYSNWFINLSGNIGLVGATGNNGTSGTSGTSGIDGTSGTSGTSGSSGTSGATGPAGPTFSIPNLNTVLLQNNITNGININISDSDVIMFDNGSFIHKGYYDEGTGGGSGIELVCSVGYPLKWEAGALYSKESNGEINRNLLVQKGLQVINGGVNALISEHIINNETGLYCADEFQQIATFDVATNLYNYGNETLQIDNSIFQVNVNGNFKVNSLISGNQKIFVDEDDVYLGDQGDSNDTHINIFNNDGSIEIKATEGTARVDINTSVVNYNNKEIATKPIQFIRIPDSAVPIDYQIITDGSDKVALTYTETNNSCVVRLPPVADNIGRIFYFTSQLDNDTFNVITYGTEGSIIFSPYGSGLLSSIDNVGSFSLTSDGTRWIVLSI